MKRTNYFKLFALAIICCLSTTMVAQTTVTVGDSIRFMTVLDSMKTNGGGSIQLSASVKIPIIKNQTYGLESTVSNPIQINTNQFSIIANGDGTSADSCFLRIGNYMTITGTGTVISSLKRGHIRVVGGSVTSNTTTSGTSTIYSSDGWIYIWGGAVNVNATGLTAGSSAAAVTAGNYMALSIMGGTISATGDYTRAVVGNELGNGVIKPISGATINASGSNAFGIQVIGVGADTPMYIGNNLTINTSSIDATDVGIINSGTTSLLIIPATVTNLNITSTTNLKQVNSASVLYDLRGVSITANPVTGSTLTYPTNNVVLTATGNSTMTNAGIYYAYSSTPTITSPNITSGASVVAGAATITIKASIGKLGFIDSNVYSFSYTVNSLPANTPINVTTFADLQAAYTTSQTATVDTTRIILLGNVTNTSAFTMTPDPLHPVVINANNFSLITGANLTLGGALSVYSTTTTGILKISGAFTTTISGGTYTVYGNAPIIYANAGSGIDNVLAKLYLSNSTFNVYGTTNAASIVKFVTSNGNLVSITNCTLNASAKAVAINCIGPLNISFSGSTINMAGSDATSIAVSYAPTNAAPNVLTLSGLTVNMTAGKVMVLGGTKALNTVVKDLTVSSSTPTLYTYTAGTGGTLKFYDFRAFTPTVNVSAGSYTTTQVVTPSLTSTAVLPVDAVGATMVYTIDGTEPTATSTPYITPINISSTTVLKVAAIQGGFTGKSAAFNYAFPTPGVTTQAASLVSYTTATGNGTITLDGSAGTETTRGFCWDISTNPDPTIALSTTTAETGTFIVGSFTGNITGLTPGTSYKVRAYATNSAGTSYGPNQTVVTLIPAMTISQSTRTGFTYVYGSGPSAEQTFTVAGTNLAANISVAPTTDYEISATTGTGYGTAVSFAPTSGTLTAKTVYVRLKSGLVAGNYNAENISIASQYSTSQNVACSGIVAAAPLTVTGLTGVGKVYDGTNAAILTGTAVYTGLVTGDVYNTVLGTPTATFADVNAGTAKPITITGFNAPSANYTLTQPVTAADITQAPLTITGLTGVSKAYDGTNAATLSGTPAYVGLVNGEQYVVTGTPVATFADVNPATSITILVTGFTAPTANYSLTQPTGLSADITSVVSGINSTNSAMFPFTVNKNNIISKVEGNIEVIALNGVVLKCEKASIGSEISLATGVYIIRVTTAKNVTVQKVVL